jgi:hypothetical protein
MNRTYVGSLRRSLTARPSRRDVLRGLGGVGIALGSASLPPVVVAKQSKGKPKPNKPQPNQYGCLEVGDPCGRSRQCCSGVCKGKPGKKRCRAHDTGTCEQEVPGLCTADNPAASKCNNEINCACLRTTAGSNFCADLDTGIDICAECKRDADCEQLGYPSGSACAPIAVGFCAGTCETGMACVPPCGYVSPES